jgi:hypothetical protein
VPHHLTVPETYRLRLTLATAGAARERGLRWARWRRCQQARARRSHARRRAPAQPPPAAPAPIVVVVPGTPALTPGNWAVVASLLPAPARTGRPRSPAARVLAGILWVMHTGAPWREIPPAHGPWRTCHDRYAQWRRDGTWGRIYAALAGPQQLTE